MTAINRQRLYDTLRDCIQTPSPQPDMDAVRSFIRTVVQPRLEALPVSRVDVDSMGNLVARVDGEPGLPPLLIVTYAATVAANDMPDAFVAKRIDGTSAGRARGPYMWGRGASEQKGPMAAALEAVTTYLESHPSPRRGLILAATVSGEMGCHDAVAHMMSSMSLPFGPTILAVGSNNAVGVANMGRIDAHVEVMGTACHSSDPAKGRNAIEGARRFLTALLAVPMPPADPDLGRPTLTPTFIDSWPTSSHTLPSRCRLILDRRLVPGEDMQEALAGIDACRQQVDGFDITVTGGRFNYPSKTPLGDPLVGAALSALSAQGLPERCVYHRGATDAGFFSRHGVGVINMGPGEEAMMHTNAEMVALSDLEQGAMVYESILQALLG
jgi:succinyl-diaminopimelate desuccinylase